MARPDLMRASPFALTLLLALLPAIVLASGMPPPESASRGDLGGSAYWRWIGPSETEANATIAAGSADTLWFSFNIDRLDENVTSRHFVVNVTSDTLVLANGTGDLVVEYANVTTSQPYGYVSFAFTVPAEAQTGASYHFDIRATELRGNVTNLTGTSSGVGVVAFTQAPTPFTLTVWLVLAAAVVIGGGAGALVVRRNNERKRMNALDRRRSQALREETLEGQKARRPEEVQRVQTEIREAEQVREQRREVQILHARRADALKTLDLLQKRHEAGALTRHQFDQMAAKKRADLERIEAEIAQMEAGDGSSAT